MNALRIIAIIISVVLFFAGTTYQFGIWVVASIILALALAGILFLLWQTKRFRPKVGKIELTARKKAVLAGVLLTIIAFALFPRDAKTLVTENTRILIAILASIAIIFAISKGEVFIRVALKIAVFVLLILLTTHLIFPWANGELTAMGWSWNWLPWKKSAVAAVQPLQRPKPQTGTLECNPGRGRAIVRLAATIVKTTSKLVVKYQTDNGAHGQMIGTSVNGVSYAGTWQDATGKREWGDFELAFDAPFDAPNFATGWQDEASKGNKNHFPTSLRID